MSYYSKNRQEIDDTIVEAARAIIERNGGLGSDRLDEFSVFSPGGGEADVEILNAEDWEEFQDLVKKYGLDDSSDPIATYPYGETGGSWYFSKYDIVDNPGLADLFRDLDRQKIPYEIGADIENILRGDIY